MSVEWRSSPTSCHLPLRDMAMVVLDAATASVLPALQLVNAAPESELCRILRDYGEEKSWRAVARRLGGG
jgi:16S rRNA C1402 N4-methylase RsmH